MFQNIFDFWIDKGVDGILFDDVHVIFEHEEVTLDEPVNDLIENPIPVSTQPHTGQYSTPYGQYSIPHQSVLNHILVSTQPHTS